MIHVMESEGKQSGVPTAEVSNAVTVLGSEENEKPKNVSRNGINKNSAPTPIGTCNGLGSGLDASIEADIAPLTGTTYMVIVGLTGTTTGSTGAIGNEEQLNAPLTGSTDMVIAGLTDTTTGSTDAIGNEETFTTGGDTDSIEATGDATEATSSEETGAAIAAVTDSSVSSDAATHDRLQQQTHDQISTPSTEVHVLLFNVSSIVCSGNNSHADVALLLLQNN